MRILLYIIGGYIAVQTIIGIIEYIKKCIIGNHERTLNSIAKDLTQKEEALKNERAQFEELKVETANAIEILSKEKATGFPWLAAAYSEYFKLIELRLAEELENKKPPAKRAAEEIRAMAIEKANLRRENKILRDLHAYYECLFPWLIDFKGEDLDDLIRQANQPKVDEEHNDPVVLWLSEAERNSQQLSNAEKFQRALDRYWQSKKSPWQLGQDYERYIGYLHEREGFKVEYHGIERGLEDFGRDLICTKDNEVRIVQCKYWSSHKTMHEKHVCQIFGTGTAYKSKSITVSSTKNMFKKRPSTAWRNNNGTHVTAHRPPSR